LKFRSPYMVFAVILVVLLFFVYSCGKNEVPHYLFLKNYLFSVEDFTKAMIVNPQNVWVIGASGSIYKSGDSCESWSRRRQPDGTALNDMYFLNEDIGWITGENGILLSTTDSGKTWSDTTVGDAENIFTTVFFRDENTGFIAGGLNDQKPAGVLYSTMDGGRRWNKCDISIPIIFSIVFLDTAAGICCTSEGLLRTEDGGKSWLPEPPGAHLPFQRLFFINHESGWAAGIETGVYSTSDGGRTWNVSNGTTDYKINDIFFIDSQNGWAVGKDGVFLYTLNGGKSWVRMETGVADDFFSVYFFNIDFGLICGRNGIVIEVETLQ